MSEGSECRWQIEQLIYRYAERIDLGDFEGVADLFEHATILPPGAGSGVTGREAVLAMYTATTRKYEDGTPKTKHVTSNVIVELESTARRAAARSYFTVFQALEGFPLQAIIAGRYHDEFERVDDEWRFSARKMLPELFGDLSRHLLINL
jgi:3-phenylpropionate/cinnamic acid dioxygenase small subunit